MEWVVTILSLGIFLAALAQLPWIIWILIIVAIVIKGAINN